ncbi:hypothetical protein Pint_03723 [Pistacia integerrima]|uniref:Uncharacterized protein n=1 Tax=Pistacia integerrima TaxID=434235 RepID=A0ACC0Z2D8_9ROSI|nr:hypothetical protein Pint_03723 [Pistacia integerrima]
MNLLTGSIPRSFGKLMKLQVVSLWGNAFKGAISDDFGNCSELIFFDVSNNFLTDNIPRSCEASRAIVMEQQFSGCNS